MPFFWNFPHPVEIVLTLFSVLLLMEPHMNRTSLMNVSDGCPTLTCLSLKLRRCYFYVISTVSMLLVIIIINYDYCHIALYKMNCFVYYYYICISFIIVHWTYSILDFNFKFPFFCFRIHLIVTLMNCQLNLIVYVRK